MTALPCSRATAAAALALLGLTSCSRDVPNPYRTIAGLILESPVVDWRVVLEYQARNLRVPTAVLP